MIRAGDDPVSSIYQFALIATRRNEPCHDGNQNDDPKENGNGMRDTLIPFLRRRRSIQSNSEIKNLTLGAQVIIFLLFLLLDFLLTWWMTFLT